MKKEFKELTAAGQTRRLNTYAKQREELGVENDLFTIVHAAKINVLNNGAKNAIFRLRRYNKATKTSDFITASAYIKPGKDALETFYADLKPGQLVSIDYKNHNGFLNIWNLMKRNRPAKAAVAKAQA